MATWPPPSADTRVGPWCAHQARAQTVCLSCSPRLLLLTSPARLFTSPAHLACSPRLLTSSAHLVCSPRLLACAATFCRCSFSHCHIHLLHLRFYSPRLQPDGLIKVFAPHAGILRQSSKRVKGPLLFEPLRECRRQMPSSATCSSSPPLESLVPRPPPPSTLLYLRFKAARDPVSARDPQTPQTPQTYKNTDPPHLYVFVFFFSKHHRGRDQCTAHGRTAGSCAS